MKSLNCKVTVANVSLFINKEGRQMIGFAINEKIPARRFDETIGEYVPTFDNSIAMPLRQFGHIIFFETATMMQYYLAPKERSYYKQDMTKMMAILKAAKQARGKKFDFATEKTAE